MNPISPLNPLASSDATALVTGRFDVASNRPNSWTSGAELFVVFDNAQSELAGLSDKLKNQNLDIRYYSDQQGLSDLVKDLNASSSSKRWDAIHVFSHGSEAALQLGKDDITGLNLNSYAADLARLGQALNDQADLLLYGCDVGRGITGQRFVSSLASMTGADVAASVDVSGQASWALEAQSGIIETDHQHELSALEWGGTLAAGFGIGEVLIGAFAGYAVETLINGAINLVWGGDKPAPQPDPTPGPTGIIPTGIEPNKWVKNALFIDSNGDLVEIKLQGPGSFMVDLVGGLTNTSDAKSVRLRETNGLTGLSINVTPIELGLNAGAASKDTPYAKYNRLFSSGYTNIERLFGSAEVKKHSLGSVELSGVIVNNIDLPRYDIANITLDTAHTAYVDRVNTTTINGSSSINNSTEFSNNQINNNSGNRAEVVDFAGVFDDQSPVSLSGSGVYSPVTGLIDLHDVKAASIGTLVVNGSISATTSDPNDKSDRTNDLRGVIDVSGRIGSIEAIRSRLNGSIKAGSIGDIDLGRLDGTVQTTDAKEALTVQLPYDYQGFIKSKGHLNLGYTFEILPNANNSAKQVEANATKGEISSEGGISGIYPAVNDTIFIPNLYAGVVINTSKTAGIADININGSAMSRWKSSSNIGNITANTFTPAMTVEAEGSIGNIETYVVEEVPPEEPVPDPAEPPVIVMMDGFFEAGNNIGNIKSSTSIKADFRAKKGSIGTITALTGSIASDLIEAGQSIGNLWSHKVDENALPQGKIIAQNGNIGDFYLGIGTWGSSLSAPKGDIGDIKIEKGSLGTVTFSAGRDIGDITVKGANAIQGGTIAAGRNIGAIKVTDSKSIAVKGVLIQAGDEDGLYQPSSSAGKAPAEVARIKSIDVTAYGGILLPAVSPGLSANNNLTDAILKTQILAGAIGPITVRAYTGNGVVDTVVHAKQTDIAGISAVANGAGLLRVNAVAEKSIGNIAGLSEMQGDGISDSQFFANQGSLGLIKGRGGVAGGHGIAKIYSQSKLKTAGFDAVSNANQGHAVLDLTAHAGYYGTIRAEVLGGEGGPPRSPISNAILNAQITGYEPPVPGPKGIGLDSIEVINHSINGQGIANSIFDITGQIKSIKATAFNATALNQFEVTASQSIGSIDVMTEQGGTAIAGSTFRSKYGDIGTQAIDDAKSAIGDTVSLRAISNGGAPNDNGISASNFTAYGNIGNIEVKSTGGTALLGSTFDADFDTATSGFRNLGKIGSISVENKGIYPQMSNGIDGSRFTAANIGKIQALVHDFRGGTAIKGSDFTAKTAIYNNRNGAFDNTGTISTVTVKNNSRTGNGIEDSSFVAGASGGAPSIGDINVDTIWQKATKNNPYNRGASGKAIYLSSFRATGLDPDQAVMNGKIGKITVNTGRVIPTLIPPNFIVPGAQAPNDQFTAGAAGIDLSYFAAFGGIGDIKVTSIGTAIFGSAFLANNDVQNPSLVQFLSGAADVPPSGGIASLTVNANGRFASGVVTSAVVGRRIGPVSIQARTGPMFNQRPVALTRLIGERPALSTALRTSTQASDTVSAKTAIKTEAASSETSQSKPVSRAIHPRIQVLSDALNASGVNSAVQLVSPETLQQYTPENLQRYVQPLVPPVRTNSLQGQGSNALPTSLVKLQLGAAPVTASVFAATGESIGSVKITNLNSGSPFLGSLFYARRSYGPVTTQDKATKNALDAATESGLRRLGYKRANAFTSHLSAFIGEQIAGGNLPRPIR